MTVLKGTAKRHGFTCLLHEKPFAGINGSGKHVNWSVGNSTQGNLLDPGHTPHDNLQFLLFCAAVIRGVHRNGPLLRAVVATAGNDHRLGANEAPPAIISVYLGQQLEQVFQKIQRGEATDSASGGVMRLGVDTLPEFPKDAGDRNRTSPFAFTGNRFEFRAVGSGQSVAGPLVAMNTVLADSLEWISDRLEAEMASGQTLEQAAAAVLKQVMDLHGAAVFGGDGYADAWHREATEQRGLENLRNTAEALPVLRRDDVRDLFQRQAVISPVELESRYEVYGEQYVLAIEVEARVALAMVRTQISPAVDKQISSLARSLQQQHALGLQPDQRRLHQLSDLQRQMDEHSLALEGELDSLHHGDTAASMHHCAQVILPRLAQLREAVDGLEARVDDDRWPLPSYREMLFVR
jgi:glutamine synthetase